MVDDDVEAADTVLTVWACIAGVVFIITALL
jgi:hypothetical protein